MPLHEILNEWQINGYNMGEVTTRG